MKPLILPFLLLIALCSSAWASNDEPAIDAKDAARHVAETVVVTGPIADVHQFKGGSVILDFGEIYPNEMFEGYIPKNLVDVKGDIGAVN